MIRQKMGYAVLVGLALMIPAQIVSAITLELIPSTTMTQTGQMITVDVVVSGLADMAAPSLGSFTLVLQFDNTLFTYIGTNFGTLLGDPGAMEATTNMAIMGGDLTVLEVSLLTPAQLIANQPDTFTLFTASFNATSAGTGVFGLVSNSDPGDENGAPLTIDNVIPTTVTITPAMPPEIPTVSPWGLLALTALLLTAAFLRLRRAVR